MMLDLKNKAKISKHENSLDLFEVIYGNCA